MHSTYAVSRVEYLQPEVPVMTADILYSINPKLIFISFAVKNEGQSPVNCCPVFLNKTTMIITRQMKTVKDSRLRIFTGKKCIWPNHIHSSQSNHVMRITKPTVFVKM